MNTVLWWNKILEERDSLEKEISGNIADYKLVGECNKKLNKMSALIAIADKANLLFEDNKYLEEIEGKDRAEAEEMIKRNRLDLEKLYEEMISLKTGKTESINKLILEIRPGAGGDESALFVNNLFQLYQNYARETGWAFEVLSVDYGEQGIKSISVFIEGEGAYNRLEFEAGVHRVQRIPVTEANGRIHTSTATVAVLPEAEDIDIEIDPRYLRIDVYRAGGAGGQHVNKTESAVRLVYHPPDLPKPEEVKIQDEKSQHKNKAKAMKILKARVAHAMQARADEGRAMQRRAQVGQALRSEKIRTYNFQQNRVTDHRCKISVYNLQSDSLLLASDVNKIIDALQLMGKEAILDWTE